MGLSMCLLDFMDSQASLAEALCEKDLVFPLATSASAGEAPSESCNAIVWWFEADMGSSVPVLSSAPRVCRPPDSSATHWVQAVTGIGQRKILGSSGRKLMRS